MTINNPKFQPTVSRAINNFIRKPHNNSEKDSSDANDNLEIIKTTVKKLKHNLVEMIEKRLEEFLNTRRSYLDISIKRSKEGIDHQTQTEFDTQITPQINPNPEIKGT